MAASVNTFFDQLIGQRRYFLLLPFFPESVLLPFQFLVGKQLVLRDHQTHGFFPPPDPLLLTEMLDDISVLHYGTVSN